MKILKILFMAILGITLVTGLSYGASKGKGADKGKGKVEKSKPANNNQSGNGQTKGRVEKAQSHPNNNQSGNAQSGRRATGSEKRRKDIDRARGHVDIRANRPEKENHGKSADHSAAGVNKSERTDHGRSSDHKKAKDGRVENLFKALEKARWSYNPHDDRGQGNMGQPKMRDPYGHDKDSGRKKSERGRPVREVESERPLLDLAGMVTTDFEVQDYMLTYLKSRLTYYLSLAKINDYMTRWVAYYESLINGYLDKYNEYRVRVNREDIIDYTMTLSPTDEFEGITLQVTTTLTSVNDYQYSTWHYVYDPTTDTGHWKPYVIEYNAGQVVMEQTQEVVLGEDNTLSFSYDPPADLAGYQGFNANLSVTVTEPVSGQSYTMSPDKQIHLYRCPYGKVTNAKTGQSIIGAKITIHFEDGSIVPLDRASNPTATNPQITDVTGRYGFKLQTNRKYYITATAPGYKEYRSEIFTEKWHVLREDVKLIPIEQVASNR